MFTITTKKYQRQGTLAESMYLGLGLASEAGEVAGKIKKWYRDGVYDSKVIASELSDVCWYFARLCDTLDLDPREVLRMNMEKLQSRKDRGVLGGSGDNR